MPAEASDDYKISRKVGYAATLKTAPAFSFGTKRERRIDDPGPGPGQYGPSLSFANPGIGFGSSTRYQNPGTQTPSPLDYKPDAAKVLRASASFTFGGKQKPEHLKSKTPGPGQYEPGPGKDSTRPGRPAYTIANRWADDRSKDRKPGPNEYNPDYRVKENPGVSIKFKHEPLNTGGDSPGPGQYDVDRAHRSPPGKTFGTSRTFGHLETDSPGPVYDQGAYEAVRPRRQSWSIGKSQRSPRDDNGVPGPGTYLHAPVIDRPAGYSVVSEGPGMRSAPAATITGRYIAMRPPAMPGPQDYKPTDAMRKSAPAFTLHGATQKDSRRNYPGPGHYESGDAFKALRPSPPAITIAHRPDGIGASDRKPGPNEYSINWGVVDKEKPGVTIKFKHEPRFVAEMHGTPAPHDYANKDFVSLYMPEANRHKGYTFGVKPKPKTHECAPGPIYAVGCSTLGVAAADKVSKARMTDTVVL
eukprot:CAMPEP_0202871732 /NCGR_PEP_ID=MMETSP1391-20130828/19510_1 /ASSEMBLY_ACC=CAM_ASM_000867 /TAXON_ID=1034604 /ORGANISM="Chlamydomonas leiostraca, Strain SAG 11-49" /LENGTH=470 /DNA_ID=CAMNT_0049552615 /DNA_START=1 /DNA_END=1413 /DNA_ORIENTATION=-